MENEHLTEENIQAFILKEIVDESIQIHLSHCYECQAKYDTYETLVSDLSLLQHETFSFDVTAVVMQKIEAVESKKIVENNNLLYAILGLSCVGFFAVLLPYFKIIFLYFLRLSIFENGLLFITALGITIYLLGDIFKNYKKNELLLFE
jgi:predicted anti-sigma-YlaC factor YlaD